MVWAEHRDRTRDRAAGRPGVLARAWACAKLGVVGASSPLWIPATLWRASDNHRRARRLIERFPGDLVAIRRGDRPSGPADRVRELPSGIRLVITSDLHRSITGRLDWPQRQRTKGIYLQMLDHYAQEDWHLCENGDIEDFWMVGGSTYGSVYDALRLLGGALATFGRHALLIETHRAHLDRVLANNREAYERIRHGFVRHGRYHRTVGNHDDPLSHPLVADRLREHLGNVEPSDFLAIRDPDGDLVGVIAHGHRTDGWCAPGRDGLGKASSWLANTLVDVPGIRTPEGLPDENASRRLLEGRSRNGLITVNPTFGATATYDSLDEELLFEALDPTSADPWIFFGHTHVPLRSPRSRTGRRWLKYMNSGSGVLKDVVTAIEWDGTSSPPTARLVAWTTLESDSVDTDSEHPGPLRRVVLEDDGNDRLRVTSSSSGVAESAGAAS